MACAGGEFGLARPRSPRRFQHAVLNAPATLERGSPDELVLASLDRRREHTARRQEEHKGKKEGARLPGHGPGITGKLSHGLVGYELSDIMKHSNLSENVTRQALETLLRTGSVKQVGTLWFAQAVWESLVEEAVRLVREQHQQYPLRSGLSKEEWRARLHLPPQMATEAFTPLQAERPLHSVATYP